MNIHFYTPVVESWKVELIVSRAKRLGFRRHDVEDAVQDIVLDVMGFRFEAERSNRATEATALTALVDRRLKSLLRAKCRYHGLLERAGEELLRGGDNFCEGQPTFDSTDQQQLALDVRDSLEQLPPLERIICLALSRGESISAIARRLGCCWQTVDRLVSCIRERFETGGLAGWIRG